MDTSTLGPLLSGTARPPQKITSDQVRGYMILMIMKVVKVARFSPSDRRSKSKYRHSSCRYCQIFGPELYLGHLDHLPLNLIIQNYNTGLKPLMVHRMTYLNDFQNIEKKAFSKGSGHTGYGSLLDSFRVGRVKHRLPKK